MHSVTQFLLLGASYPAMRAAVGAPMVCRRHSYRPGLRNDGTLRSDVEASSPPELQWHLAWKALEADHA